jgi:hypothetical protein
MKEISVILVIAACITLIFCSGCTSQQATPAPATQAVTITETPIATITSLPPTQPVSTVTTTRATAQQTIDPLPKDVADLPPAYAVDIGIDKDRVYNTITVSFTGGRGQVLVKDILVRVTKSDGTVEEKNIPVGNQVATGASVDIKGTQGSDRVEVFVTLGGITYKVKDENMVYARY